MERQRAFEAWLLAHPGPHEPRSAETLRTCRWADHWIARIDEELARLARVHRKDKGKERR